MKKRARKIRFNKAARQNTRRIFSGVLALALGAVFVTTAWAAFSLVHPSDKGHSSSAIESQIPAQFPADARSRAPEPSTMALFGSGVLGMIATFIRRTYAVMKRIFDVSAAVIGFIVLSPLFILTTLLIKLTSKGPVLYTQTRVGKDGEHFKMYKFRTMKVDAEKDTGPVWAAENDNRLIPVGNFLRKAHIDEIPQFYNILRGDMSLIGPRPERPVFVEEFKKQIPDYEKRLQVKPGLTGLAQVWHKYDETLQDVKRKIKYDLLYIKKYCLWTDIRILFRTFRVVLTGEGAR